MHKPMEDTTELDELDELDGKLYVLIRDFNQAGRAAVRAGLVPDRARYYRFNHLGPAACRPNRTDEPAPEPTPEA